MHGQSGYQQLSLPLSLLARASAFPLAMQVGARCLFVVLMLWKPLDVRYGAGKDIRGAWIGIPTDMLHRYLGALGLKG